MSAPGFWDKPETAQEVGRKRARVEKRIASGEGILNKDSELDVLLELQREGEQVEQNIKVFGFGTDRLAGSDALLYAGALASDVLSGLGLVPETGRGHLALDLIERLAGGIEVKDSSGPIADGL